MERSEGFPAVARTDARTLILGSLPGTRSIAEQQYYAHPQNAFWSIMEMLYGICGSYDERCNGLLMHRVAVWDVLRASIRPGSMDADIDLKTAVPNNFAEFLTIHMEIDLIAFNGGKAEQLFGRLVQLPETRGIHLVRLPSTSPAYAAMPFSGKLEIWKDNLLRRKK